MSKLPRSSISLGVIPSGIRKLDRRLADLAEMKPSEVKDLWGTARRIATSINATMDDVFGVGTADSADFNVDPGWFWNINSDRGYEAIQDFEQGLERARAVAKDAIKRLNEKAQDAQEETEGKTLKAYAGS
jgi:hypothetical protein